MNWFKNLFDKKETVESHPRRCLVCVHGFGVNRSHEMDELKAYCSTFNMECIAFDMFDCSDETDNDWKMWVKRAEEVMIRTQLDYDELYLLGFSMGGVIASYLATRFKVERLILISPAFNHFHLENYTSIVIKGATDLINRNEPNEEETKKSLPKTFYASFLDCVKQLKNSISQVQCPVLILQGDADEIIPCKSSEWAFDQIPHDKKRCIFLHGGHHRVLQDPSVNQEAFILIQAFIEKRILAS